MTPDVFAIANAAVMADTNAAFTTLAMRGFSLERVSGFYPRVRAQREVPTHGVAHREVAIDFWMSLTPEGGYRAEWSRAAPFDLGGCVTITRAEGGERIRYWRPYTLYASKSFADAIGSLATDLQVLADTLESWSDGLVLSTGKRVRLPPPAEAP